MTDLKENNDIVYKRGIWKSFAMIIFLFCFILSTLIVGVSLWCDDAMWNEILLEVISQSKIVFIISFLLTFYAINSTTFYRSHIIIFYPFLFWQRRVNYSDVIFAEFIMVSKGSNVVHLYRKKRKRASIETPGDHMKILKLLSSNDISIVIREKSINSRLKKKLEEAEIIYSNKELNLN